MCNSGKTSKQIIDLLKHESLYISAFLTEDNIALNSIRTDSRKIEENDVFVCIKGFKFDGSKFAEKAINNGAVLLISEQPLNKNVSEIIVSDSRKAAAAVASFFFEDPTSKFKLIGITGTNGKTTVAHLTEQILSSNGKNVGLIGTLGYKINGKVFDSALTTPDIIELNEIFFKMTQENVEYVIMEVSSHSSVLDRIYGLKFDIGVFTNLSQDHLDFHKDIDKYIIAKYKFINAVSNNNGIIFFNIDDTVGKEFYEKIKTHKFSISNVAGDYTFQQKNGDFSQSNFSVNKDGETKEYKTKLFGEFNIFNLTTSIAVTSELGVKPKQEIISKLVPVKGRLQRIENDKGIGIFIDYAHTPDALENLLSSISMEKKGRLFCVFGAGGNRDKTKRPVMLKASLKFADVSLITTDNPRFEDPADIIRDIICGSNPLDNYWIIQNRKKAIEAAICLAQKDDIVIIAGKGHETYQDIKGIKQDFDEIEIVSKALNSNINRTSILSIPIDDLMLEKLFGFRFEVNPQPIQNVSTDSRSIIENSLFFALKGDNFDGHNYVTKVLQIKGCRAIVNADFPIQHKNIIRVNDTLEAYGMLAKKYLSVFNVTKIAITGSVGKTTTKEILFNIVSEKFQTLKTLGNENNLIGLPKTIFRISPEQKYAIFELGTNHFGEIAKLADICNPDIGIITSIGASHLEFLENTDGVFREKTDLFKRNMKLNLFPGDDAKFNKIKGISFGKKSSNKYVISDIIQIEDEVKFKVNNIDFSLQSQYSIFVENALIAIAVGIEMGFTKDEVSSGLRVQPELHHRMEIQEENCKTLLIDCYNANPDSMKAAIDFWQNYNPQKPHFAILGDMLELGTTSEYYHKEIGSKLKNLQNVFSVGNYSKLFNAKKHFTNVEDFCNNLPTFPKESVILIKASNSVNLEKIIGRL